MLDRNPQFLTPVQMDSLKASIRSDGFVVPILVRPRPQRPGVNPEYQIVSGNHRFMAARELGLTHVPAVVKRMSDRDAARLAINLNTVHGEPTPELLAPFLAALDDETLREIHLDAAMLDGLLGFDALLAERLSLLEAPPILDRPADTATLPRSCRCPTCGASHAKAQKTGKGLS